MTASGAATTEVSAMSERPASGTDTVAIPSALSIPNKPMVPTAHAWLNECPIDPVRRHMGRPLGKQATVHRSDLSAGYCGAAGGGKIAL